MSDRITELERQLAESRAREARLAAAAAAAYDAAEEWHLSVDWEGRQYTGAVIESLESALKASMALWWLEAREKRAAADELQEWAAAFWAAAEKDVDVQFTGTDFEVRMAELRAEAAALLTQAGEDQHA